jgi:hypothetical protein
LDVGAGADVGAADVSDTGASVEAPDEPPPQAATNVLSRPMMASRAPWACEWVAHGSDDDRTTEDLFIFLICR